MKLFALIARANFSNWDRNENEPHKFSPRRNFFPVRHVKLFVSIMKLLEMRDGFFSLPFKMLMISKENVFRYSAADLAQNG